MSDYAEIVVLVEGKTEEIFIKDIVRPYLSSKGVFITPIMISKPGQKGGDVKFERVKNDIKMHLKQRPDTFLTLLVDYYGIRGDWPGLEEARGQSTPSGKAEKINSATKAMVNELFGDYDSERRFIPYVAMHEFEAMLFSDAQQLSAHLQVPQADIDKVLSEPGEPEKINDKPESTPSKRLEKFSTRFGKTSTGMAVARATGLVKIREKCPIFHEWLISVEGLAGR